MKSLMSFLIETINESSKESNLWKLLDDFKEKFGEGWTGIKQRNELRVFYDTDVFDLPGKSELIDQFNTLKKELEDAGWKVIDQDVDASTPYMKIK